MDDVRRDQAEKCVEQKSDGAVGKLSFEAIKHIMDPDRNVTRPWLYDKSSSAARAVLPGLEITDPAATSPKAVLPEGKSPAAVKAENPGERASRPGFGNPEAPANPDLTKLPTLSVVKYKGPGNPEAPANRDRPMEPTLSAVKYKGPGNPEAAADPDRWEKVPKGAETRPLDPREDSSRSAHVPLDPEQGPVKKLPVQTCILKEIEDLFDRSARNDNQLAAAGNKVDLNSVEPDPDSEIIWEDTTSKDAYNPPIIYCGLPVPKHK